MSRQARVPLVCLALAAGWGCSGEAESRDPNQPAGKVVELSGQVAAAREGAATRPLAAGDPVFADDTVTTGADGSAVILLAHNQVRWSLGSEKSLRVDRSLAWKAEADEGGSAFDDKDEMATASAGRHTDREAGDTAATAQLPPESKPDPAATEAAPAAAPPPMDTVAQAESEGGKRGASPGGGSPSKPKRMKGDSGGGGGETLAKKSESNRAAEDVDDEVRLGGATAAAPMKRPESAPSPGMTQSAPITTGRITLGKLAVKGARKAGDVATRFAGFASGCTGKVPGTVTLRFDIDAAGAVKNVRLTGSSSVLASVSPCVTAAARGLKFAAVAAGGNSSVERELRIEMR